MAEVLAATKLKVQFEGRDIVFVCIAQETYVESRKQTVVQHHMASLSSVHLLEPKGKYATHA